MQNQVEQPKASNTKQCDEIARGYDGDDDLPASPVPPSPSLFFSQQPKKMIKDDVRQAACPRS